jgi:hypothetical protein
VRIQVVRIQAVRIRVVAAVVSTAVVVAACGSGAQPAQPLLSRYESATGNIIVRDCGYSVPLPNEPGRSLWLFCDTDITSQSGHLVSLPILGTGTAAEGADSGQAPGALTEIPTPGGKPRVHGAPEPFLPAPSGLTLPASGLPCAGPGTYPARWITGVARVPGSSALLISFDDYCVTGDVLAAENAGVVEYTPADNRLGTASVVFEVPDGRQLPPQWTIGSPVFADGYLYMFGSCAAGHGCGAAGVFLTRTLAAPIWWNDAFAYRYWTGAGWSTDPASARSLLSGTSPLAISAGDYAAAGHGLVIVEETSVSGTFSIWQAAAPAGPWRRAGGGQVPCTPSKDKGLGALCRALIGHPELSTANELLISFFNPGDEQVEVASFSW